MNAPRLWLRRLALFGVLYPAAVATLAFYSAASRADTIDQQINAVFTPLVDVLAKVLFWDPFGPFGLNLGLPAQVPLIVLWLIIWSLFFTVRMGFINVHGMRHGVHLIMGRYANPNHPGDVSHFRALTAALSGTVGLGNIAGVAVAITLGGPGATFWMILAGFLGMASKFTECTLGVKYRLIRDGEVSGGPMFYLSRGLANRKLPRLGRFLAVVFAIMCVGGSLGGGNMFQANQAFSQLATQIPVLEGQGAWFGVVFAFLVGVVIIGGIKSIASFTARIVPLMCGIYVLFALLIIIANIGQVDDAFCAILTGAFNPDAAKGGLIGVLIVGVQRAVFSCEAGIGSASIVHATSRTKEPVSEGFVALLEPFIDTVVICTMTALVLIFTGFAQGSGELAGVQLTSAAFSSVFPWFRWVLLIAVLLFAFSTMISWSYYGTKAWGYLFGRHSAHSAVRVSYQLIFLFCIVIGASSSLGAVLDFSDMMILSMAFPNILGLALMSGEVRRDLMRYLDKLRSGKLAKNSD